MHHVGAEVGLMQEKFDIDSLVRRLTEDLPASVRAFRTDIEAHAARVLKDATRRMDLVSREEFDSQTRVLARSRELITALESRIAALEQKQGEGNR
jgi:BMFP domain-containing protein YqiC